MQWTDCNSQDFIDGIHAYNYWIKFPSAKLDNLENYLKLFWRKLEHTGAWLGAVQHTRFIHFVCVHHFCFQAGVIDNEKIDWHDHEAMTRDASRTGKILRCHLTLITQLFLQGLANMEKQLTCRLPIWQTTINCTKWTVLMQR